MKNLIALTSLFLVCFSGFSQNLEEDKLWRTKGVYDSLGNFVERAKIQSFLYTSKPDKLIRLSTKDRMNMETGETKVFVYTDTLTLKPTKENTFTLNDKEQLTIHSKDSLTIHFNGYVLPYVKLTQKANAVKLNTFKTKFVNVTFIESVAGKKEYELTYQDTNLVKVAPLQSSSQWESDYKIIDFNGFIIIQGIVSAPKLITDLKNGNIYFSQIDYRFENTTGELIKK